MTSMRLVILVLFDEHAQNLDPFVIQLLKRLNQELNFFIKPRNAAQQAFGVYGYYTKLNYTENMI